MSYQVLKNTLTPFTINGNALRVIGRNGELRQHAFSNSIAVGLFHGLYLALTGSWYGNPLPPFEKMNLSSFEISILLFLFGFTLQIVMPVITALVTGVLLGYQGKRSDNYETYRIFAFCQLWLIPGYFLSYTINWMLLPIFYILMIVSFSIGYANNERMGVQRTVYNLPIALIMTYFGIVMIAFIVSFTALGLFELAKFMFTLP